MHLQVITVPYRYDEHREGLGLGPEALLDGGLLERLRAPGREIAGPEIASLETGELEQGRTAVNIGLLGARTAALVAASRKRGAASLVLAGDDTAGVGVVSGLQQIDGAGAKIGVVWIDAHGDFNTPETSYSGILAGMTLAIIAGLAGPLWRNAAGLAAPVPTDRMLLAGVRDLDEKEEVLLRSTAVRMLTTGDVRDEAKLQAAIDRLAGSCSALSVHVDLDVLDPHLIPSATTPSANGLSMREGVDVLATVLRTGKVASVIVNSLNPGGGQRGERSIASALSLLQDGLAAWDRVPDVPTTS